MSSSKHHTDEFKHLEVIYEEEPVPQINLDFDSTKLEKPAAPKKKKKPKKDGIDLPLSPHQPEPEGLKPLTFSTPVSDQNNRRQALDIPAQNGRMRNHPDSDRQFTDSKRTSGRTQLEYQTITLPGRRDTPSSHYRTEHSSNDRDETPSYRRTGHNSNDRDETPSYRRTGHNSNDRDETPSYRRTRLADPIQKGGDAALRMIQSILRNLSAILILSIIAVILWHFWRSSTPYGDISLAMQSFVFPPALTTYLCVAVCIVLYELIALLWTMSKPLLSDEYGSFRADTGRGTGAFIGLYLCSYAAFLLCSYMPDLTGLTMFAEHPDWLELFRGITGGLDVFGSLHNLLFGLCIAGVISCLVRKYSSSL